MPTANELVAKSHTALYRDGAEAAGVAAISPSPQTYQYPVIDYGRLMYLARQVLIAIGEDPDREGLLDTPRRFADWWTEFIQYDPGRLETTFESMTKYGQMVTVSGLRVWSVCEHHMIPFWCDVSIGYYPKDRILGLSKFARIAHKFAHRLQVQERLAGQVADEVEALTGCADVAVFAAGEHLCMTMRGVRTPGLMSTSVARGRFENQADWDRFFQVVQKSG